jgi:GntR family transcriptional regulator
MAAKYITIAREIKKRIISQQYAANEPLPDQFALAAEFSTSRMTIQQAMRQLIVEGLVYTRQGQGRSSAKISCSSRSGISPAATILVRPKPGNIWARSPARWCISSCASRTKKSRRR